MKAGSMLFYRLASHSTIVRRAYKHRLKRDRDPSHPDAPEPRPLVPQQVHSSVTFLLTTPCTREQHHPTPPRAKRFAPEQSLFVIIGHLRQPLLIVLALEPNREPQAHPPLVLEAPAVRLARPNPGRIRPEKRGSGTGSGTTRSACPEIGIWRWRHRHLDIQWHFSLYHVVFRYSFYLLKLLQPRHLFSSRQRIC